MRLILQRYLSRAWSEVVRFSQTISLSPANYPHRCISIMGCRITEATSQWGIYIIKLAIVRSWDGSSAVSFINSPWSTSIAFDSELIKWNLFILASCTPKGTTSGGFEFFRDRIHVSWGPCCGMGFEICLHYIPTINVVTITIWYFRAKWVSFFLITS